jgi:hypothetical protein
LWNGGRTDSTSVDLDSSVEIGQIADCVGALGDDGAGDGEAAERAKTARLEKRILMDGLLGWIRT